MKDLLLRFFRKITGYYDLVDENKQLEDIIHDFQLLCKKVRTTADETLHGNNYNSFEPYKVGLRKIIADIDYELKPEKEKNSDNLLETFLSE